MRKQLQMKTPKMKSWKWTTLPSPAPEMLPAAEPTPQPIAIEGSSDLVVSQGSSADKAVDREVNDESRWAEGSDKDGRTWLELQLPSKTKLAGIHLYSGYGNTAALENFHLEFLNASGKWATIPSADVTGNQSTALRLPFDTTLEVETDRLRLVVPESHQGLARIQELVVWPLGSDVPAIETGEKAGLPEEEEVPKIYLNQSGFRACHELF